ncbi:MAG: hypothetical protein WCE90_07045 [Candidatus Zixiibacteriota bacterium]
MNKRIIVILILTVVALIGLAMYTFGPMNKKTIIRVNPVSLKPAGSEKVTVNDKSVAFVAYHNKDLPENFYTLEFPKVWQVTPGKPGGYALNFDGGSGTIGLTDVPDNSTLELFLLSQEEPKLKKTVSDYRRMDYRKLTVNGAEAYQLLYQGMRTGGQYQTIQTYVGGSDEACIITFTTKQNDFSALSSIFSSVTNTFHWENK